MLDKLQLELINSQLKNNYGKQDDGRPNWRVILNEKSLTEKRWASKWKYDKHGNWLGQEDGVQVMPKYTYLPYGIYILEQLYFMDKERLPKELSKVEENCHGLYEPRWPFMTRDFKYLEPTYEGCEFIIKSNEAIQRAKRKASIKTQKQKDAVERQKLYNAFGEIEPAFDGKKHSRMYPVKNYGEETPVGKTESQAQPSDGSGGQSK